MSDLCVICVEPASKLPDTPVALDTIDTFCSHCWGPIVIDTRYQPFPFCVLFPENKSYSTDGTETLWT